MRSQMISEIDSVQPEYLVWVGFRLSWLIKHPSDLEIFDWFNRYADQYYELVGAVNRSATGETSYLWDAAARNHNSYTEGCLLVFKRKPASEIGPVGTSQP